MQLTMMLQLVLFIPLWVPGTLPKPIFPFLTLKPKKVLPGFRLLVQFFLYLVAYLSSYHEKAIKALYRARLEVASHLSTTPR